LKVFTLYVGQGALSVVVGDKEAVVIDAHIPPRDDEHAEHIRRALAIVLAEKKVRGLLLTGLDADHADHRGVAWILRRYQPDWIVYPTYFKETKTATTIFKKIIAPEVDRRSTTDRPLEKYSIRCDTMKSRVLSTLTDQWDFTFFSPHLDDLNCSNNGSIVVKVTLKSELAQLFDLEFSYLITGDTENDRWEVMNKIYGRKLQADVLAAPHHGSENAINKKTLNLIEPHTVLVSCGVKNQYGHPDEEAMKLYRAHAKHVMCTGEGNSFETSTGVWSGLKTRIWSSNEREKAA
jgi:beta-lactamase superfamily II metal-dependent hydrolase